MIQYEDECVGCPKEMGCLGSACPHMNVPHYYCDKCDEELDPDDMYGDLDDEIFCRECFLDKYRIKF